MELLTFIRTVSKGKVYLHLLDPRYYQIFLDYGVNEIEFVNCNLTEIPKKDSSLDFYQEAIATSYHDFLSKERSTRLLDVYITSVRMKNNSAYKIRYVTPENSLKFKNSAYPSAISTIRSSFPTKEKMAIRQDLNYRQGQ